MRPLLAIATVMALGCQATGPSGSGTEVEPRGWIYFASRDGIYVPPARVNVATGDVEMVDLPPQLLGSDASFLSNQRFVSPANGDLSGRARLTGFGETFLYDATTREIRTFPVSALPYSVTVDEGHTWAPDGSAVVFRRHQSNGHGFVLVVLRPASGQLDTLLRSGTQPARQVFWLGPDTLIFRPPKPGGGATRYVSLSLAARDTTAWTGIAINYNLGLVPTVSGDRRWVTIWRSADTVVGGFGQFSVNRLHLLDRIGGMDSVVVETGSGHLSDQLPVPVFFLSETFDPSSRFLAFCSALDKVQITDLESMRVVKELDVPWCSKLNWSWGPEGPPS